MSNSLYEITMPYADFVRTNELLRSCHSVAMRKGEATNWDALVTRLETELLNQQRHCPEGVMRLDAYATAKTFKIVQQNGPVSLANARNTTNEVLQRAMNEMYDEVFFIGIKNGGLSCGWSGFDKAQEKIGAIEMLKHDILARGN